MDKSDSATPVETDISIQQGDWSAYRNHIESHSALDQRQLGEDEREDEITPALAHSSLDSSGQPLNGEDDIIAYRRQCARAYIGMNGRLGGRAYRANEPVILTPDAVGELAELNRLLREERAQKKR
ncbi:hypothetical protein [Herbaspirillum sp. alder98]|uniref:hypothetical protein n=1 Tax=Herbaspirillum sp. alder98 TaxID=2913096 RepID=UPI001CD8FB9C|nr:hypothetical protein [Herbaspirillum sp. alder98]MCA1323926.1 hypothetical protein [Herbaspirillum sp. alder98]